jgi:hypothetical protein
MMKSTTKPLLILSIKGTSKTAEQLLTALGRPRIAQTSGSNQGLTCSNEND